MTTERGLRSSATVAFAALMIAAGAARVSAHRLDEYLQAALVAIDPGRVQVELDLTPGVAVAGRVLSEIDRDRDGSVSADEAQAYTTRVLGGIALDVDGIPLAARAVDYAFPSTDSIRKGEGTIRIHLAAVLPHLTPGAHRLTYRNGARIGPAVYLANALVPATDRVAIENQRRDADQRALEVDYLLGDETAGVGWRTGLGAVGMLVLIAFAVQSLRASASH
jgi:hypothetical protein